MRNRIIAADVGSTTTKAVLFERGKEGWRVLGKAVAPTTVEAPDLDVMIGLRNALAKLERRTGRRLLDGSRLILPSHHEDGTDVFVATSSAGGGLQMLVTGLVKTMTAESAHRAALGAGAIVSDILSLDDNRVLMERIDIIRKVRPDMILVTGGTDGGNISDVAAMAEYIAMANPEARFGKDFKIPVIYAGNLDARGYVEEAIGDALDLSVTDNIRPSLETEVLGPAREEIHRLFLEHVMMRAPGYKTLASWTGGKIKPTPVAVGDVLTRLAKARGLDVLGVDVGGATTDVFSVISGQFFRTVSANLGMSYSLANVLAEAKVESVLRWIPWETDENSVRNWGFNKMIRPTTLPQTMRDLVFEQAVAREALRLSLDHHCSLIRDLKGIQQKREVGDVFNQLGTGATLVDLMKTGLIIGSGGVLSYAPRRAQAALMMMDALQPLGITELAVDSQFLLPHLGVLMDSEPETVNELMSAEALVELGTVIAPSGHSSQPGSSIARVEMEESSYAIEAGEIRVIPLPPKTTAPVTVVPKRGFDVGNGPGRPVTANVSGGIVGLILDGRGRPLSLPEDNRRRVMALKRWAKAMDAYPESMFADSLS
ncbi:MAG TPA: methylaspartate mutase [Firmicutes bacterium]|nr:methylaspartate mutase [Candidatus Fermentithermobacillaceae bacterium]